MGQIKNKNIINYGFKHVGGPCYELKLNENISIWFNEEQNLLKLCSHDHLPKWTIFWDLNIE